jgi:hypothetical protein
MMGAEHTVQNCSELLSSQLTGVLKLEEKNDLVPHPQFLVCSVIQPSGVGLN